jgi:hypothetical protein
LTSGIEDPQSVFLKVKEKLLGRTADEVDVLLQLGLLLLLWSASRSRNPSIGSTVQDVLAIDGALAQRGPAFGVVVICMRGVTGRGCDIVLDIAEIREKVGDANSALFIY